MTDMNLIGPTYYQKHKEEIREKSAKYYKLHREECNSKNSLYVKKKRQDKAWLKKRTEKNRERYRKLRILVLDHYGNKCACCGETIKEFLTIDHINGNGKDHRKITGVGENFYRWITKNNYPKDLQILCYNCNIAKMHYGQCVHETRGLF